GSELSNNWFSMKQRPCSVSPARPMAEISNRRACLRGRSHSGNSCHDRYIDLPCSNRAGRINTRNSVPALTVKVTFESGRCFSEFAATMIFNALPMSDALRASTFAYEGLLSYASRLSGSVAEVAVKYSLSADRVTSRN